MLDSDPRNLYQRKFRTRPSEITAIRFMGGLNLGAVMTFLGDQFEAMQENSETMQMRVVFRNPHKHADFLIANEGDWIIRGLENEFYPCVNSVFERKYEEIQS